MSGWRLTFMAGGFVAAACGWYAVLEGEWVNAGLMFGVVAVCAAESWRLR